VYTYNFPKISNHPIQSHYKINFNGLLNHGSMFHKIILSFFARNLYDHKIGMELRDGIRSLVKI